MAQTLRFRALAFAFGLAVPLLLIGGAELVCRYLDFRSTRGQIRPVFRPRPTGKFEVPAVVPPAPVRPTTVSMPGFTPEALRPLERIPADFFFPDEEAKFRTAGRPNSTYRTIVTRKDGNVLVDVNYSFDEFGRRVVPGQGEPRPKFAVFFGCSFMFGEAVSDRETLPYFFSRADRAYRAYNYGVAGWGTSNVWLKIRNHDFSREVTEKDGIGVYLYGDFHLPRNDGSASYMVSDGLTRPYVTEGPGGEAVFRGSFLEARPITTRFYQLLNHSHVWSRLGIDLPGVSEASLRLAARMMREMSDDFEKKTHGKFYVVTFPNATPTKIIPYLEAAGVHYLDLSPHSLLRELSEPDHIPYEGHPSPAAHRWIAGVISQSLRGYAASKP